jgi:hypothetical protein
LQRGRLGIAMTAHAHDTITDTAPADATRPVRRADAGMARLSQRDIDALLLGGEHYRAPADLLYLTAPPARGMVSRAAATLRAEHQVRVTVRELPAASLGPELSR